MSQPDGSPALGDLPTWRWDGSPDPHVRTTRWGLALWWSAALLLLAWFVAALWEPFQHPRVYVVHLVPTAESALDRPVDLPPVPFRSRNVAEFDVLRPALAEAISASGLPRLPVSPGRGAGELEKRLRSLGTVGSDVLVVYVSAHGVSYDGRAYVTWGDFPSGEPADSILVGDLLQAVASQRARTKLVVFDVGHVTSAPELGMLVNQFPRLLAAELGTLDDDSLWAFVSNSTYQDSSFTPSTGRSRFTEFVVRGLSGEADEDGDDIVDLRELEQYVIREVGSRVDNSTGGAARQTPKLLSSGPRGLQSGVAPTLISVSTLQRLQTGANRANSTPNSAETDEGKPAQRDESANVDVGGNPSSAGGSAAATKDSSPTAADSSTEKVASGGTDGKASPMGDAEGESSPASKGAPAERKDASPRALQTTNRPNGPEKSPGTTAAEPPAPLPTTSAGLRTAVDGAFRLRDALLDWSSPSPTPFELAPHTWRRVELELLRLEQQAHFAPFHATQGESVRRLTTLLRSLRDERKTTAVEFGAGRFPRTPLVTVSDPTTLGMLELFAPPATGAAGSAPLFVTYDGLLASNSLADFRTGLGKVPQSADRFAEIRLARQLAGLSLDWPTLRRILQVQRFGERVAAGSARGHEWVAAEVALADNRFDELVRLLTTEPWRIRTGDVERLLDEANTAYGRAARVQDVLSRARRAQARTAYVLPQLLDYCFADLAAEASTGEVFDGLVTALRELDELTSARRPENWELIETKTGELLTLLDRADSALNGDDVVQRESGSGTSPVVPGDVQRSLRLLATPYATASRRRAAWGNAVKADARLERLLGRVPAIRHSPSEPPASRRRRVQFARRAAAEVRVARLTARPGDERLTELDAAARSIVGRSPTPGDVELDWNSTSTFARLLRDYERGQATRIGAVLAAETPRNGGTERIDELRRAWLGSALMDARIAGGAGRSTVTTQLAVAETYEFLSWQRQRAAARLVDAPGSEQRSLDDALRRIAQMAVALPGRRTFPPLAAPSFTAEGTSVVELVSRDQASMTVKVRNGGADRQAVTILLDFDPQLVTVKPRADLSTSSIERLPNRRLLADEGGRSVAVPTDTRPAFVLEPGEVREIVFDVRRVAAATRSTNVVFRALTATQIARNDTVVAVPRPATASVEFSGPFEGRKIAGGEELRAFPNRETAYAVTLRNLVDSDDTVHVTLHAPGVVSRLPSYSLTKREAAEVVAGMRSRVLGAAAKVALAAGDSTPITFVASSPSGSSGPASTTSDAPPRKAASPVSADPLPHGLVVAVETAAGRVSFHPVSVAVLHPRGYVRATADFDAKRRRLHVELSVDDGRFLPEKGLPVRGETRPPLSNSARQHVAATIQPSRGKADLFLNLPENLTRAVEFGIDVGGYPRAFRFHLEPGLATGPVAVDVTRPGARLNAPEDGAAFAPTGRSIAVGLSADLPTLRGATPRFVEVGFDTNRDRRFGPNEATTRFQIDRTVQVLWGGFDASGRIQLKTSVTDLQASLPAPAIANGRVNLLVHSVGSGREDWSVPRELVFDGTPPSVSEVEVGPSDAVAPGTPFTVSAVADDGALSGVASVRIGFDDGSGRFTEKPPAVAARLGDAGRWQATVPTKGLDVGRYRLLIEATDRAGNVSEPLSTTVNLASAEGLLEIQKARAVTIGGRVSYGGDPVPDVTVSLTPEKGKPLPTAKTDENGRFQIPGVPPGTYDLQAKGVSRNKIRTLKQTLTVPADGKRLPDLDLQLPR